jgi:gamma-glutamyltranspeptidase / glutathione hydrolase
MRGIVAAGHPETAGAAVAVLREGGNAFDAALAAMCAAVVVEPVLASLGGGGFLAARPGAGRLAGQSIVYDFFVQTPKRRRPQHEVDLRKVVADFGPAQQEFHIGMGTIATPGAVKGLFEAHRDLGRMPIRRIVEPAIGLAQRGVPVNAAQAYALRVIRAIIEAGPATRALFASRERPGELIGEGELLRLPDLAGALEILAIEGEDLFYRGEMGRLLTRDCADAGGQLSAEDLRDYRIERRRPLDVQLERALVQLNPPPSMGGLLVAFGLLLWQALGKLAGGFGSSDHLARLVDVIRATARARAEIGQGAFAAESASDKLLDPTLTAHYRDDIVNAPLVARGTTQISVIDAAGGAAGLSLSNGEGSGYVLPGTGIILNNMLGEADLNPGGLHSWPTDKRMASMMTPAIVLEAAGGVTALGSGGSNRIRTAMLQALLNLLAFDMPLQEAIAAPRLHVEDEKLSLEPGFPETNVESLARIFADVERWPGKNMFFGGVHAVRRSGAGALDGAGDERRGGVVGVP